MLAFESHNGLHNLLLKLSLLVLISLIDSDLVSFITLIITEVNSESESCLGR